MISANLPDIDVLAFFTSLPAVAFRRGWTHGPLAQLLLPLALTAILVFVASRRRAPPGAPRTNARWLFILSLTGVLSHVALDVLNTYGLRILAPFSWRWFYGDALFIVDPWLWGILGLGIFVARRTRMRHPARQALILALLYVAAMTYNARLARHAVLQEWRTTRGGPPANLMAGPVAITPFRKQVIVDDGLGYHTASLDLLPYELVWERHVVPRNDDDGRTAAARRDPRVQGFLAWSRFPFWTFEAVPGGTRVIVRDMRFTGQGRARFEVSTIVREVPP